MLTPTQEAQVLELINQQAALLSLAGNEASITSALGAEQVNLSELTPATVLADTDLLLVRQGVTDKSTSVSILKSGLNASNLVSGTVAAARLPAATEAAIGALEISTAAEAQAGTSDTVAITPLKLRDALNASGTAPIYACRAWVNFNGTGTVAIRASGNVSSITDNGLGDYTVNFTNAMPDANYGVSGFSTFEGGENNTTGGLVALVTSSAAGPATLKTASAVRIGVGSTDVTTLFDNQDVSIAIFR